MKTRNILLMAAILMGIATTIVTTSCTEEDNPVKEEETPASQEEKVDDVTLLLDAVYLKDNEGNRTNDLLFGEAIHQESPNDYYVGVDDIDEAKKNFLYLINDNMDVQNYGNDIVVNLKDADDNYQGYVSFKEASQEQQDKDGIIAEVTFSPEVKISGVDRFVFIKRSLWPHTIQKSWYTSFLGDLKMKDSKHGDPVGLCIRLPGEGTAGIIIVPLKSVGNYYKHTSNTSDAELKCIADHIFFNNLQKDVRRRLNDLGLETSNTFFWSNSKSWLLVYTEKYAYNIYTTEKHRVTEWDFGNQDLWYANNFLSYWWRTDGQLYEMSY